MKIAKMRERERSQKDDICPRKEGEKIVWGEMKSEKWGHDDDAVLQTERMVVIEG